MILKEKPDTKHTHTHTFFKLFETVHTLLIKVLESAMH